MTSELDHLVWGCPDLNSGVSKIVEIFAKTPTPGGVHPGIGTRNALLGLEGRRYFEILAPDPNQSTFRSFGRWIEGLRNERLLTWAGRSPDLKVLSTSARKAGLEPGPIESMSRQRPDGSSINWKLMSLGGHEFKQLVPFFIEWQDFHPSQSLEAAAGLEQLRLFTPRPKALAEILSSLALDLSEISLVEDPNPRLEADLLLEGRRIQIR